MRTGDFLSGNVGFHSSSSCNVRVSETKSNCFFYFRLPTVIMSFKETALAETILWLHSE